MWRKNFKKWIKENRYPKREDLIESTFIPIDARNYTGNVKTDDNEICRLRSIALNIIDEENDKCYVREIKVNSLLKPLLIDENGDTILKIEDIDKLCGILFSSALIRVDTPENC